MMTISNLIVEPLLIWYESEKRDLPWRKDRNPYHVWVSEIMLQQTRVEAVKSYYTRFLTHLPDVRALADAPEELLLKLWEGLGYYNRVRNMQCAARQIVQEYGGNFPQTEAELLRLKGIGAYTAGAIGSICFELPTPAVDGNVLRVISRLCASEANIDLPKTKAEMTRALAEIYPNNACGTFTQALMELGATVCVPNGEPHCDSCPIGQFCRANAENKVQKLPVRTDKKQRKAENMTVFLLYCKGMIAVQKRPKNGLLAGLWEFPHVNGKITVQEALTVAQMWDTEPQMPLSAIERTHIFTHKEWHMRGMSFVCGKQSEKFVWATKKELSQKYALPSAFSMFLEENFEFPGK